MFFKTTKAKKSEYIQIVESYRENGKPKHRVLFSLGKADVIANNLSFQKLAKKLLKLTNAKDKSFNSSKSIMDCSEGELKNWGYKIYRILWEKFELNQLFEIIQENKNRLKLNIDNTSFLMTVQHLLRPLSKLATYEYQTNFLNYDSVKLNHLYRCLDILCEKKEEIEKYLCNKNKNLFNMKIDIVFYDVTTFYFESVESDGIRKNGYSKDGKFNEVQVVLGLLVDTEGRPIGYELFEGNTFDGNTLSKCLESLEKKFGIRKVIIVADKGINGKLNLKLIKERGYDYIVAARIKNMPESIIKIMKDETGYKKIYTKEESEKENNEKSNYIFKYKVIDYKNFYNDKATKTKYKLDEKLIITYSPTRAEKDKKDRDRLIEKAKKLLENPSQIKVQNKRGGKKYLKEESTRSKWVLDKSLIEKDSLFDGYYGIQTSEKKMESTEVINAYHKLWKIEESFRIMKTTLESRPIFVWTDKRIKGHFVICFLAFLLERTLEIKLMNNKINISPEKIRKALNSLSFFMVDVKGEKYLIKNKLDEYASKILKAFKIPSPKNITLLKEFNI